MTELRDLIVKLRATATAKREHYRYAMSPENREGWYAVLTDEEIREDLGWADFYDACADRLEEQDRLLNTPELHDFSRGAVLEALHQRERWGSSHDAGKTPFDWFWLIGYLAQKAAAAHVAGDVDKALHHCISTAAALANWHAAISGEHTGMRPGIEEPET